MFHPLFAQDSQAAPGAPGTTGTPPGDGKAAPQAGGMSPNFMLFLMAAIALFYIVVILPANRRQKREQAEMVASIKQGSKVATTSGIVGTIVTMKDGDDEVVLRSEDTKIRVLRSTIQKVITKADAEAKA